jgi:hypothetical protein
MTWRLTTSTGCALLVTAAFAGGAGAGGRPSTPAQRPPVVVQVGDDGFHWGDAAVGAAAVLGLTFAAGGLVVLIRARSPRQEGNHHA